MSKEPELKTIELKVYVHCCDGCKRKVKKALQMIEGVVRTEVHASLPKVTVEVRKVDAQMLIKKLGKIGKPAEIWTNASGTESAQKNSKPKAKDGENEKKSSNEKEKCPSGANEKANKNENSEKGSAVKEGKKDKKDVKDGASSNSSSPPEVDKKVSSSPPEDHTIRPGIVHYTGDAASGTYPYTPAPAPPPYLPQTYYMMTAYSAPPMYYVQDPYYREMSTMRRRVPPSEPMLADYFDDEDSVGCSIM